MPRFTALIAALAILTACSSSEDPSKQPDPAKKSAEKKGEKKAAEKPAPPAKTKIEDYEIETATVEEQHGVAMRKKVKPEALSAAYQEGLPKAFAYAAKHGEVQGMPFAIYHAFSETEIDVEFGCPVKAAVKGDAEIKAMSLPAGKVVKTTHFGSYDGLPKAHGAIDKWFEKYDAEKAGPPWEVYIDDPTAVEPDKVRTFVFYPIK